MIQCIGLEVCGMQVSQTSLSELIPYINNSRTHSDQQISQIAASIKEFGFNNPILIDGDNGIIAGHGRVLAAQKLKLEKVPTIELSHLTESQRKAYIIADNKLALNSGWDSKTLKSEIFELNNQEFDLTILGFKEGELDNFLFDDDSEEIELEEEIEGSIEQINDIKMVQLFFDPKNYEIFQASIESIISKHNCKTISDAVLKAIVNANN